MIVFGIIAERDVDFFVAIAKQILKKDPNEDIAFISFYEPGNKRINDNGFKVYSLYDYIQPQKETDFLNYSIENIEDFILHEQVTFSLSKEKVVKKYKNYLPALNRIIEDIIRLSKSKEVTIFQELGGFVAPMSLYFCARKHNLNHYFFEPSFFKGKLFFVKNDYMALKVSNNGKSTDNSMELLLKRMKENKTTVIPKKDTYHFENNIFKKIFILENFRKIYKKIIDKYLFQKKQEYDHVFNHILRNLNYMINSFFMKFLYKKSISKNSLNIYFPLHVPLDYSLTIRAPEYFDQLNLVDELLGVTSEKEYNIYIKEHPAAIGGFSSSIIKNMINKHGNRFSILHPSVNTYDIIDKMDLVITINSKSGAEALANFNKVICLGDSFYSNSEVINCKSLSHLNDAIIKSKNLDIDKKKIIDFFSEIYSYSYNLELYLNEKENIKRFAKTIVNKNEGIN